MGHSRLEETRRRLAVISTFTSKKLINTSELIPKAFIIKTEIRKSKSNFVLKSEGGPLSSAGAVSEDSQRPAGRAEGTSESAGPCSLESVSVGAMFFKDSGSSASNSDSVGRPGHRNRQVL